MTDVPTYLESFKVFDFLRAIPGIGKVKAQKMLNESRVSTAKTLAGLTDRQRRELAQRVNR